MKHQQRLTQVRKTGRYFLLGDIIEKFTLDAERSPRERDLDFALIADLVDMLLEQSCHMSRVAGRGNGHHGNRVRNAMRRRKYGSTAETVPDQDGRCAAGLPQTIGSSDKVVNIRREMGIGEFPFACTEAGKVEAQNADSRHRQPFGDPFGRKIIFATSEAVREQSEGIRLPERQVHQCREVLSLGIGKFQPLGTHDFFSGRYSAPAISLRLTRRTTHQMARTAAGTNSAVANETLTGTPSSCAPLTRYPNSPTT